MSHEKPSLKILSKNLMFGGSNSNEENVSPSFTKTVLLAMNLKKSPWLLCRCRKTFNHVQYIQKMIRSSDKLNVIVRLERSSTTGRDKYLVLLSDLSNTMEQYLVVGMDVNDNHDGMTIGLIFPITKDTDICLDGEGGFYISCGEIVYSFQPASVQEVWTALQALVKAVCIVRNKQQKTPNIAIASDMALDELMSYYKGLQQSDTQQVVEWIHLNDDLSSSSSSSIQVHTRLGSDNNSALRTTIRRKLQEILPNVDLDMVTSKQIRDQLEEVLKMDLAHHLGMTASQYNKYMDEEVMMVMRQMDSPSQILDFLYLGSEWNASNLEELQRNGVGYILNVTKEIDNFFPGMFKYCNVRVYDYESTELLKHWDGTFKFIDEAKRKNCKILVHCKMGVSRSASTVIAYLMKGHRFTLEHAYQLVKQKRSCVQPNPGFMKQLIIYQGILDASNHRHSRLFRSRSIGGVEGMDNDGGDMVIRSKSHIKHKAKHAHKQVGDKVDSEQEPSTSSSASSKTSDLDFKSDNSAVKKCMSVPNQPSSSAPQSSSSPPQSPSTLRPPSITTSSSPSSTSLSPTAITNETFSVSDVDVNCLQVASTTLSPSNDNINDNMIILNDDALLSSSSVLRQWSCLSPEFLPAGGDDDEDNYNDDDDNTKLGKNYNDSEDGMRINLLKWTKNKKDGKEKDDGDNDDGDEDDQSSPLKKVMKSISWPCLHDNYITNLDTKDLTFNKDSNMIINNLRGEQLDYKVDLNPDNNEVPHKDQVLHRYTKASKSRTRRKGLLKKSYSVFAE